MRIKKQSSGNVRIRDYTLPGINYKPLSCILLLLLLVLLPSLSFAGMNDYCLVPPYVTRSVVPNIMIVYEKGSAILDRAYSTTYDSSTTYYGFFKSTYNYAYDSTMGNDYFIKSTTCTPSSAVSTNCFSGNVLNWALMSSLDLSRKALIGFGEPATGAGTSAGEVFTYAGTLDSKGQGNTATVSAAGYTFCLSNATGSNPTGITIRFVEGWANCSSGTRPVNGGDVVMRFTDETRVGIIQRYADDSDQNYKYDIDAPRFGVRRWNNGNDKQEDIIIDSSLTLAQRESYFRSLLTAISKAPPDDPQTPNLSNMMEEIVDYFKGLSSDYQDNDSFSQTPYSWGTDPMKACRKTYAFFITTGANMGTTTIASLPAACTGLVYPDEEPYITAGINGTAVTDPFAKNTCYAYNTDLYTTDSSPPKQNISTYVVHTTFYGGGAANEAKLTYAASISDGEYIKVNDPNKFEEVIEEALLDMLRRSVSGTAASVLASGEGSGANLVQAVFYPKTPKLPLGPFSERMDWLGRLSNYWYYIDPFFSTSTILEDSTDDNILDLSNDRTVKLRYDTTNEYAVGDCYDYSTAASANCGQGATPVRLEYLKNLWDAGIQLWNRDITVAANKRKIYTTINGTGFLAGNFSRDADNGDSDNSSTLRPYFNFTTTDDDGDGYKDDDLNRDGSVNDADANILIRYIHGEDFASYTWMRSRTVAVDLNGDGDTSDTVDGISEGEKVWKLGDVLNSTPKISSWIQLNTYDSVYSDTTYREFLNSANYTDRGMVFTGANDGMLHAFKLGKLELSGAWKDSTSKKAYLSGSDLGKEIWTFIPKNVLPYLKYLKETLYCHVYTVDLTPYIFDASIGAPGSGDVSAVAKTVNHWRTILIGGMRLGGACKNSTASCTVDLNGDAAIDNKDCVKTPISDNGYSSYFALDITDQNNPTLLWEFSNTQLGFATTGPAILRLRIDSDTTKNGKWFVVFGSGPTGPISITDQQFLGNSDQNLRLFVLDLKTGSLLRTIDTGIQYAFAGSILNATHDSDLDYQDDAVYIPYVKKCTAAATYCTVDTWTNGGIGRLLTIDPVTNNETSDETKWTWNAVIDNIGPVTSAIAKLRNKKTGKLWLYFGTGRYYFEQSAVVDDGTTQRRLFGIKDPCFQSGAFNAGCADTAAIGDMIDKTCAGLSGAALTNCLNASIASDKDGWYIDLDAAGSYTYTEEGSDVTRNYRAERVITDPLATSSGIVFFTAYKPYNDVCAFGGKTFIWAVKYDTGGAAGALLKGIALLQVSTGSIEQIDLSSAFGEAGGRKTAALEGVPPTAQGLSILSTPPAVKRVIHMRER